MRNLTGIVLKSRISKRYQLSNWNRKILDEHQQLYAATDACVWREIYLQMMESDLEGMTALDQVDTESLDGTSSEETQKEELRNAI